MSLIHLLLEAATWDVSLAAFPIYLQRTTNSQSSVCSYLFAFLRGFDVNLSPLLEGLPENMSDQRLASDLHGDHVPGSLQDRLWGGELAANIVFGQLDGLGRELLRLVPLVTVSQIFSKLLWSQAKLLCQAVYVNDDQTKSDEHGEEKNTLTLGQWRSRYKRKLTKSDTLTDTVHISARCQFEVWSFLLFFFYLQFFLFT